MGSNLRSQFGILANADANRRECRANRRHYNYLCNIDDLLAEVVGHKLATHPPVIEPVSAAKSGTEICDAETGTEKPAFLRLRFNIQSRVDAHGVDVGFFVP
jgi:hypothetical protein